MPAMRLSERYSSMTTAEREKLAQVAGLDAGYLYQIATRWRGKKPSIELLARIAAADPALSVADMLAEFTEPQQAA